MIDRGGLSYTRDNPVQNKQTNQPKDDIQIMNLVTDVYPRLVTYR